MHEGMEDTVFEATVSVITLVGQNMRMASRTVARALAALGQENMNIIATVVGPPIAACLS